MICSFVQRECWPEVLTYSSGRIESYLMGSGDRLEVQTQINNQVPAHYFRFLAPS